jgi:hypothetical protein
MSSTLANPLGIAISGSYIYISNRSSTIAQLNLADVSVANASFITNAVTPYGMLAYNNFLYAFNGNTISKFTLPIPPPPPAPPAPPCFLEGTKILTENGYQEIEKLRKGDKIKTLLNGAVAIEMIGKKEIHHPATHEARIKEQLYRCSTNEYPELLEDLIITGCHSILVEVLKEGQEEKTREVNGDIYVTDKKYRLPACVDERTTVYEPEGKYTIYHIALENDDYFMNYGIFANGLLVETCSKRYLAELSEMTLLM